jgi:DNA polymerase-3 subunit epsilon
VDLQPGPGFPALAPRPVNRVTPGLAGPACYAVLDVETTGLDHERHRVVECAVVTLDRHGRPMSEWCSLVALPGEDEVGASGIHGVTRSMLVGAPSFPELLPELVARLARRVVVGHVLAFDLAHLAAEFRRAGFELPDLTTSGVCTRELARRLLFPGPRTLEGCCAATGVAHRGAHSALGDARATARLLRWFLGAGQEPKGAIDAAARVPWPAVDGVGTRLETAAVGR